MSLFSKIKSLIVGDDEPINETTYKDYHITYRKDGRWQVKREKASKALKIFNTQAEAIEYAKQIADNQEGNITIHKRNGKTRKQKY